MTLLTEATDVFAAAESSGRCVVAFLCKRQPVPPGAFGAREREEIATVLRSLQAEDWRLSVRAMFDPESSVEPTAFDSGFACAIDFAGAFEAPASRRLWPGQSDSNRQDGRAASPPNGCSARASSRP
jgi:hypothetical protein